MGRSSMQGTAWHYQNVNTHEKGSYLYTKTIIDNQVIRSSMVPDGEGGFVSDQAKAVYKNKPYTTADGLPKCSTCKVKMWMLSEDGSKIVCRQCGKNVSVTEKMNLLVVRPFDKGVISEIKERKFGKKNLKA